MRRMRRCAVYQESGPWLSHPPRRRAGLFPQSFSYLDRRGHSVCVLSAPTSVSFRLLSSRILGSPLRIYPDCSAKRDQLLLKRSSFEGDPCLYDSPSLFFSATHSSKPPSVHVHVGRPSSCTYLILASSSRPVDWFGIL